MNKRGQVTTFMIIGLVILIIIILLFAVRKTGIGMKSPDFLQSNIDDIKKEIDTCIDRDATQILDLIGKQGGYLNPSAYRLYSGYKVAYLCFNIPDTDRCANSIVNKADIEKQITDYIKTNLPSCFNANELSKRLFFPSVEVGSFDVKAIIEEQSVIFDVDYPITLNKNEASAKLQPYKKAVAAPLGLLLDTTYNIIESEATTGTFLELQYMLAKRGSVEIYKDQPYPDKVYILNARDSDYVFQFAIQNEGENE